MKTIKAIETKTFSIHLNETEQGEFVVYSNNEESEVWEDLNLAFMHFDRMVTEFEGV